MLLLDRRGDDVKVTDKVVEAAAGNCTEVMMLLLDRRGDEVKITEKVLEAAAHDGQEGVLRLLNQRFAVDVSDWVPIAQLYNASKTGDEKVVQRLLSLGVDPNTKYHHGRTPLWWAASNGYASVVTLLLERDNVPLNEPDINGWTPLHEAAGNGYKAVVILLLSTDGIDPDLVDKNGQTALAWATEQRHTEIVHILSDHIGSKRVPAPG
jgi:hypothetical protein